MRCCDWCSLLRISRTFLFSIRDRCGSVVLVTFCRGGRLDRMSQKRRREVLLGGHGALTAVPEATRLLMAKDRGGLIRVPQAMSMLRGVSHLAHYARTRSDRCLQAPPAGSTLFIGACKWAEPIPIGSASLEIAVTWAGA